MTATIPTLDDDALDRVLAGRDRFDARDFAALGIALTNQPGDRAPGSLGYLKVANLVRCMRQGFLDGFPGDVRVCYTHIGEIVVEGAEGVAAYDYLYDFWPDLTWGDASDDVRAILGHPRFPEIDAWLRAKYGWDIAAELTAPDRDGDGEDPGPGDALQRREGETTEAFCLRLWGAGYRPL